MKIKKDYFRPNLYPFQMKAILLFLFTSLINSAIAQDIYRPFKIDNQFILADTNGNIPIAERFDTVYNVISHKSEYIVGRKGSYGVVKEGKYVFPPEYTKIEPVYTGIAPYHAYALQQNGKNALGTVDGVILTGFAFDQIEKYEGYSSLKELVNADGGVFYLAGREEQFQLIYANRFNKSVILTKDPVDDIKHWNGFFVFRKGKQETLYHFDPVSLTLKEILPFSEQYIELRGDSYGVWNAGTKTVKMYSYEHRLLSTHEGIAAPSGMNTKHLKKEGKHPEPASNKSVPKSLDLARDREILLSGKFINVHKGFEQRHGLYSITRTQFYQAQMTITGSKGDWKVASHFYETKGADRERQKDTTFQVKADELIRKTDLMSRFVVTKKENLYGVVDSRGNELLPAKFANPEYLRSKYDEEWLLIREGKEAILLTYNPGNKALDTVYIGNADDELDIYGYFIRVKRHFSKNKTQMKLVKMKDFVRDKEARVIDNNEFFDSIVYSKKFPYFFHVFKDGKAGMLSNETTLIIPCEYDSVQVNAYYLTQMHYNKPQYTFLQPIFSAYKNGKQHIFHPVIPKYDDFAEVSKKLIPSFENGTLSAHAKISDDGLYVIENPGSLTDIYSIKGKKLTKEPILLHPVNQKMASFSDSVNGYWFVRGTDPKNKEVLVGQNGALFVLPE